MHRESKIIINIPHPKALDYIREHSPEKLQIIDQSISSDILLRDTSANDLILISYTSYSIYNKEEDYALIILKRNTSISLTPLSKINIIYEKYIAKMKYIFAKK